ncbi:uncharacterized protein LOC142605929 [Castanea sativa]|uniref:uncharacterized protein LOC142605929 n=1 Tax=Castanea sativa TaxID=21020 RepID=UPI003F64C5F7
MPEIDPSVITHRLNVSPSYKPVCQKKRVFALERDNAIKKEVHKTTIRTTIGETPSKLAYGSDAVIPAEVNLTSYKVAHYNNKESEKQLCLSLDLMDEVRMDLEQRVACYKNLMAKHHNALVNPRQFNIGDLILKRVSLATKDPAHGKLGPNWEGPSRVINSKKCGSYYLEALDGRKLEHP